MLEALPKPYRVTTYVGSSQIEYGDDWDSDTVERDTLHEALRAALDKIGGVK